MQKIVNHKNQNSDSAAAYNEYPDESCGSSYDRSVPTRYLSPMSVFPDSKQLFLAAARLSVKHRHRRNSALCTRYTKLQLTII